MKRNKKPANKNDKIKLVIGITILFIIFAGAFTAFYINRDRIYYFLHGIAESPDSTGSNSIDKPHEYLQDIIFIGDSIMLGFEIYRDSIEYNGEKVLKDAVIIASEGYGVNHAVSDVAKNAINLTYGEKPMKPEDIIAERDEKYVFMCLGLNDLSWVETDRYIEMSRELLDNIQSKNPDKVIVILSITPLVSGKYSGNMNNDVITDVNGMLNDLANGRNILFSDWAEAIRDENNGLHNNLSSDGFCHLKLAAYNRLIEYLLCNPVK